MARNMVLRALFLSKVRPQLAFVQARCYSRRKKTYVQPKEEAEAYVLFRKELSKKRSLFLSEWQEKQRMEIEDSNSQAAEEARIERMTEERALEANQQELERMAKEREKALLLEQEDRKQKQEKGNVARLKYESKLAETRKEEVQRVQEESHGFITMENLDEKIQEAIENEINYNFAFSLTGEKIV